MAPHTAYFQPSYCPTPLYSTHPFELNQTSSNFGLDSQVFTELMVAATNSYFYEKLVA